VTNAYATVAQVKASLAGDAPNMGVAFDQKLADKILEVSADIDRMVTNVRSIKAPWSFLADQPYDVRDVWISSRVAPSDGYFTLRFGYETTSAISYNADASTVQAVLEGLSAIGAGNVLVAGPAGGPWEITFAGSCNGPQPGLFGEAHLEPEDALISVLNRVQSVLAVPSKRTFMADASAWKILFIDDCVQVTQAVLYGPGGTVKYLTEGVDYLGWPMNSVPLEGLFSLGDNWPDLPYRVEVEGVWGYATSVPEDVREATIIEVIRSYLSDQAGNDDRLGMTPYGSVVTTKAFTSKVWQLVNDYQHAEGFIR
jgi:hypothetical protein